MKSMSMTYHFQLTGRHMLLLNLTAYVCYVTYYSIFPKTGLAKLTDRHGVGNHAPLVDRSQDVVLEWGRQNDTHTVIQFIR